MEDAGIEDPVDPMHLAAWLLYPQGSAALVVGRRIPGPSHQPHPQGKGHYLRWLLDFGLLPFLRGHMEEHL